MDLKDKAFIEYHYTFLVPPHLGDRWKNLELEWETTKDEKTFIIREKPNHDQP